MKIPEYARRADPSRLVRLLCKGKCSCVRWAEMEQPYPGQDALRRAKVSEFSAKCLYCGKVAKDPYNWFR
jgi:hypothetical protein